MTLQLKTQTNTDAGKSPAFFWGAPLFLLLLALVPHPALAGPFVDSLQLLGGEGVRNITLGDVDNDGDLDAFLIYVPWAALWLNQGNEQQGREGVFAYSNRYLEIGLPTPMGVFVLGDVDGDGDLDGAASGNSSIYLFMNQGGQQAGPVGHFDGPVQIVNEIDSSGIAFGDLDGDGDLDMLLFSQGSDMEGNPALWLNQGGYQEGTEGIFSKGFTFDLEGTQSTDAVLCDLNSDAHLDMMATVRWSGTGNSALSVWLNRGEAELSFDHTRFLDPAPYGNAYYSLVVGDVDGDGDMDSVRSNPWLEEDKGNEIWLNQGGRQDGVSGAFERSELTLGAWASSMALGDLDNDGDWDGLLLYDLSRDNASTQVLLNQGNLQGGVPATFTAIEQVLPAGSKAVLGDLDSDGDLDAMVASVDLTPVWGQPDVLPVRVLINNDTGPGFFVESQQDFGKNGIDAELADLDNDGDLDALVGIGGDNWYQISELRFWLNQGGKQGGKQGEFHDSGLRLEQNGGRSSVCIADLELDGDLDLLFNDGSVFFNQGGVQGGELAQFEEGEQQVGSGLETVLGDLDNDGDVDAVVSIYAGHAQVWFNQGGLQQGVMGVFTFSGQELPLDYMFSWTELGDFDGDGDVDILLTSRNTLWFNQGGAQGGVLGQFTEKGPALSAWDGSSTVSGDLDGDDDLDLFAVGYGNNNDTNVSRIWVNQGGRQEGTEGTFTESDEVFDELQIYKAALTDVDNDGDLDIFAGTRQANTVLVNQGGLQQGEEGSFVAGGQYLGSGFSHALAVGDVDGDSDVDAFVANHPVWEFSYDFENKLWLNQTNTTTNTYHSCDLNNNKLIDLSELLRAIQLFNAGIFGCNLTTEDGFDPTRESLGCLPHAADYAPQDWSVDLSELLRIIQFYNAPGHGYSIDGDTEDGYRPGTA
jgi:hypothetical protein